MKPIRSTSEFKVGDTLRRVRKGPPTGLWDDECLVRVDRILNDKSFGRTYLEGPDRGISLIGSTNFSFDYFHYNKNEEPEELWV